MTGWTGKGQGDAGPVCRERPVLTWSSRLPRLLWLPSVAHSTALSWRPRSTLAGESCRRSSPPPFVTPHPHSVHSQTRDKVSPVARAVGEPWVCTQQGTKQTWCVPCPLGGTCPQPLSFQLYSRHLRSPPHIHLDLHGGLRTGSDPTPVPRWSLPFTAVRSVV